MKFFQVASILLAGIFIASCSQSPTLPPTETGTAVFTQTAEPTTTSIPTVTSTLIPSPSRTPFPTDDYQATYIAEATKIYSFYPIPSDCNLYIPAQFSQNGEWMAVRCYLPDPTLFIVNRSGTKKWELHFYDYSDSPVDGGISLNYWSSDSRYIYFSSTPAFDGPLCYPHNVVGFGLFRLDVETGKVTTILPLLSNQAFYSLSISSTGRRLVYQQGNSPLQILDFRTGEVTTIELPQQREVVCGYAWSEDGLTFAYSILDNFSQEGLWTLYLSNISTNSTKVLMTSPSSQYLQPSYWSGNDVLIAKLTDETFSIVTILEININTGQVISTIVPST